MYTYSITTYQPAHVCKASCFFPSSPAKLQHSYSTVQYSTALLYAILLASGSANNSPVRDHVK